MKVVTPQIIESLIGWIKRTFVQAEVLKDYQKTTDADIKYATKDDISNVSLGYTAEDTAKKGKPSGYAGLDVSGKVPEEQLPDTALKDTTYTSATTMQDGLMSSTDKTKLNEIQNNAQTNIIESIKRNGLNVEVVEKEVDIKVPTKLSELTNDKNFVTTTELADNLKQLNSVSYSFVEELPPTGEENVVYIVPSDNTGESNVKVEYYWNEGEWEKFGEFKSDIDLGNYWTKDELVAITEDELNAILTA